MGRRHSGLTPAQRQKRRRDRLRAQGRCRCGAMLLPEWDGTCPECRAAACAASAKYRQTDRGREMGAKWAREQYAADPEGHRQVQKAKREARKEAKICQQCPEPIAEDSTSYCVTHRDRHRGHAAQSMRGVHARKRAA